MLKTNPGFLVIFASFLLTMVACSTHSARSEKNIDLHSNANYADVIVKHINLDLTVDFDNKLLSGSAALEIENKTGTNKLILDTRKLRIQKVTLGPNHTETEFSLRPTQPFLGEALTITILPGTKLVTVQYRTTPGAEALQWLTPDQTADGKHPFLFTQSEAILARTWIPCQDSPAVRFTYSATIHTNPELLAVMSAENRTENTKDGVYHFQMPQKIPSYLLALAVGDLKFKAISDRCGVYAEPSVIEKAAWELADTEKMVQKAEELYGPYRWGRYDVIILPPSFPFGGMENPRLTFATPTILAGDRSLVSLIAHELAHSWSGNLVTNANWNDFWLNEGFTVYFEHRIMEAVYGRDYSEMLASLTYQDLLKELQNLGSESRDTHLHLDLKGRNPDDGMTDIAYNKGYFFLRTIEETVGRKKWDAFLRKYFDTFAFQSMTSEKFVDYLQKNLLRGNPTLKEQLQIKHWVFGPGIPDNIAKPHSDAFEKVDQQLQSWLSGQPVNHLNTKNWTTQHWLHFLRNLPEKLSTGQMTALDKTFHFTQTGNSEILCEWLLHTIPNQYEAADPALEHFLTSQGRRKFLQPLYKKLAETPKGLKMAKRIYQKARPGYHAISQGTIDKILNVKE